jgi:hypothetical protein
LNYSFNTVEVLYSLSIASPLGGTVSPGGGLFMEGTILLLTAIPAKNYEFIQWEDLSGTALSMDNPLQVIMDRNRSLTAKFRVRGYSDTFGKGNLSGLPWTTSGKAPWSVISLEGQYSARSGAIGDGQSSSLIITTNMYAGFGAFDWRISSEEGWDWLEFFVNGRRVARWSGEVSQWQTFMFAVTDGLTTLEWRYVKDANFSAGLDAAFIDNVYLPLERPETPATRPSLSITRLPVGEIRITLLGQSGVSYVIQASPDMKTWMPVSTNIPVGVAVQWIDPEAPRTVQRFYRAIVGP